MAHIDFAERTITMSVVYFGPAQSGCATNVRQLHRVLPSRQKSDLKRDAVPERRERVWHFRYRPSEQPVIPGFETFVRLSSVPAGADLLLDREPYISGVDAVVLVLDARANRMEDNHAAVLDLESLLAGRGLELTSLPLVLQVNHTDAPNARPALRVVESLASFGFPVFEAIARQGTGIIATHESILAAAFTRLRNNVGDDGAPLTLTRITRTQQEMDVDAILGHAEVMASTGAISTRAPTALPATAEIIMRPKELKESIPIRLIGGQLRNGRIRMETIVRREDGSDRKLALLIEPGGTQHDFLSSVTQSHRKAERTTSPRASSTDLPAIAYGVGGTFCGVVLGLLMGYLYFV